MASGIVEPIPSIETGEVTGITNSSSQNLAQLGIISDTIGSFVLFLQSDVYLSNMASAYFVCRITSSFYITPIVEGSGASAPRISNDTNGILKLYSETTARNINYIILKIA